jgi:carbamoyltransferase
MNFVVKSKREAVNTIPSVIHVNNTARAQIVSRENNQYFYDLIEEFGKLSNEYVLLNTSLNIQEPICNSPEDVLKTFIRSNVKHLFLEDNYFYKDI